MSKYINPITKEIVEVVGINTAAKTYTVSTRVDKFAAPITTTVAMFNMDTDAYHAQFVNDLKLAGLYEGYVPESEYVDWPTDSEMPEYDYNYRVSLTNEQIAAIASVKDFRVLMDKIEIVREHSNGKYVYLNQFDAGHPHIITKYIGYVLPICEGITIENNPNKVVPNIDYSVPAGMEIPEPAPDAPVDEPI